MSDDREDRPETSTEGRLERLLRSFSPGAGPTPPLPRDWSSTWLVAVIAAAMGYLATLASVGASGAESLARSWTEDLSSRATVILAIDPDDAATLAEALAIVRRVDGVTAARPLDDAAMLALVAPWIGDASQLGELPMPRLIDVSLAPRSAPPIATDQIALRLDAAGIDAEVDAHGEWVARLEPVAQKLLRLAYGALAIVAVVAGLTVAFACSASLAAQAKVVDVLKLVGAEDAYISRIFVRRFQLLTFAGASVGAAAAAITLVGLGGAAPEPSDPAALAPLTPTFAPAGADWARITLIPLGFALIATVAARIAVSVALRRREN